jgi:alginate O-acetyltransferase complex protein AlgI
LGGNRKNQTFNIFLVWGLTGLWHGASWNFVLWGLYFGLILWLEKTYLLKKLETVPVAVAHAYALLLVYFGWAIFYFTDHVQLQQSLQTLFAINETPLSNFELSHAFWNNIYWLMLAIICCTPIYAQIHRFIEPKMNPSTYRLTVVVQSFFFLLISVVLLVGKTYNPFIYFRF